MNYLLMVLKVICFILQISFSNSDFCPSPEGNLVCCPGFVWNNKESKCKRCAAGKIGSRCEIVCPYPWYGKQCLSKCHCSEDQCDPADGCIATFAENPQTDATNSWHSVVLNEFTMHTNSSQVKVEPNFFSLSFLVFLSLEF